MLQIFRIPSSPSQAHPLKETKASVYQDAEGLKEELSVQDTTIHIRIWHFLQMEQPCSVS